MLYNSVVPSKVKTHNMGGRGRTHSPYRPNSYQRGYNRNWRRLRMLVLHRDPICKMANCHSPSTDADHIIPKAEGGDNSMSNLQGLCHRCHSRKTVVEDGGFGKEKR